MKYENMIETKSEHIGTVGERLSLKVKKIYYDSHATDVFGQINYRYVFQDEQGRIYVWHTSQHGLYFSNVLSYNIKGTVKQHLDGDVYPYYAEGMKKFEHIKQTELTRVKVVEITEENYE